MSFQHFIKQRFELSDCVAAVGDGVFFFAGQLGDSFIQIRHEKNRVIAEAVLPDFPVGYQTFQCSFGLDEDLLGRCQAQSAHKSRHPFLFGNVFEKLQRFCDISMIYQRPP